VGILQALGNVPHVPQLLAHGSMPDSAGDLSAYDYLVITPVGAHVGTDTGPELIKQVVRHVATAVSHIDQKGLLHRQAINQALTLRVCFASAHQCMTYQTRDVCDAVRHCSSRHLQHITNSCLLALTL
jgi:hypothetical protein